MFNKMNDEYNKKLSDEFNNRLIIESVVGGGDIAPLSDEEDEEIVDAAGVNDTIINEMDKILDKIVSNNEEELNTTIDDLIDDDGDGDIEVLIDSDNSIIDQ